VIYFIIFVKISKREEITINSKFSKKEHRTGPNLLENTKTKYKNIISTFKLKLSNYGNKLMLQRTKWS
jgi:hypothetical protein